ncbi:MAG: inositol monophosphatase family protein [Pseudomonadota bacterium]
MATDGAVPPALISADASETLRAMAEAATHAGEALLTASRDRHLLKVTQKTAGDFVSDADHQSEAIIAAHLERAFPGYGWLGEESAEKSSQVDGLRWIVDPLDGTTNFLKGLPHWAVSIALYQQDVPLCGIIHDPAKSETFSAERGRGAYLNGCRITVNKCTALNSALLATGVPAGGRATYLPHCLRDLDHLMPKTAGIRRWGAAALDLAYVAAGRLDAYWERNLGAWDIAAGALIVEEAGGTVMPLFPDRPLLATGSFLAGDPDLLLHVVAGLDRGKAW